MEESLRKKGRDAAAKGRPWPLGAADNTYLTLKGERELGGRKEGCGREGEGGVRGGRRWPHREGAPCA